METQQVTTLKRTRLESALTEDDTEEVTLSIEDDGGADIVKPEQLPLSESQQHALNCVMRGENVFITGKAGSGKSFLIARIKEHLIEMGQTFYVTAATGSAAFNIAGMTLHSYAGIGLGDRDLAHHLKQIKSRGSGADSAVKRWKDTEVLFIDEASMISPLYLEKVSGVAKALRQRKTVAFGGIQVIIVADMFQLPPVPAKVDPNQKVLSKVENQYIFQTQAWRELNLTLVKLDVNFRQQGDERFAAFLNNIRIGTLEKEEEAIIASRDISRHKTLVVPDNATRLFAYRNDVLRTNNEELTKIKEPSFFYDAVIFEAPSVKAKRARYEGNTGGTAIPPDPNNTKFPVDTRMELKVGASVLLCYNMCQPLGLYNGTHGVILKFVDITPKLIEKGKQGKKEDENKPKPSPQFYPQVLFDNGEKRIIRPHTWSQYEGKTLLTSYTQVPLVLAYALTIHRAQGLTLNAALVDMRVFSTGQLYVALSRVRRLDDLYLTRTGIKQTVLADKNVTAFYQKHNLL